MLPFLPLERLPGFLDWVGYKFIYFHVVFFPQNYGNYIFNHLFNYFISGCQVLTVEPGLTD